MKQIRTSNFVKMLCIFLSFTIFYVSCSPEASLNTTANNCTDFTNNFSDIEDVPNSFEHMLELARTLHYQENFDTYEQFHHELFGQTPEGTANITQFEAESTE